MSAESVSERIGEIPNEMTLDRAWFWRCTPCRKSVGPFADPGHAAASARRHREVVCEAGVRRQEGSGDG